jgi:hypothetical protein
MNNIRKFGIIAALLAVVTILVPLPARLDTAFASETASDAIIQEARNEAEKLLAVRSAVWLKFLDEWNAYLKERESDPDLTAPVFSSFTDLEELMDKDGTPGYLPASFPIGNYSADPLGNEIEVAVTLSNAVSAKYVPNFLPMAEVSEGTVKLRITRPGATPEFSFFVEKNAANEMGPAGTLEWVNGQGKIAVNELESNIIRSQAGGGKIDFESTVMFGTIEGRGGASISVANTLDLGSNTLKTTGNGEFGAGEFGTVSVTNTGAGAFTVAGGGTVTGALTVGSLNAGNTSITGTLGVSGMLSASGGIDAGGSDINNIGALKAGSGTFTGELSTDSLKIKGNTGASNSAYKVWVENAKNADYATNANTLGGQTLAQVKERVTSLADGNGSKTWEDIKEYIKNNPSSLGGDGVMIKLSGSYTWNQLCALVGKPTTTSELLMSIPMRKAEMDTSTNGNYGNTIYVLGGYKFEYIGKYSGSQSFTKSFTYGKSYPSFLVK